MIRNLLATATAVAAVLAFAPAATAGTPFTIDVGTSTTTGSHNVTYTSDGDVEFDMGDLSLSCTNVGATGTVDSGQLVSPFTSDVWMRISSAHFNDCDGTAVGLMDLALTCAPQVRARSTASVTNATTDIIDVAVTFPAGCLTATDIFGGFLCRYDIVGTVNGTFDENAKVVGGVTYQDIYISGPGLSAASVSGCFGLISNGTPISCSFTFHIHSADGRINQKP